MTQTVGPFGQSPSAKYQIIEQPGALPGCCFMCRADATNREWFVDIGLQWEFWGAVYLCNACLEEISGTVGWITPQYAQKLIAERAQMAMDRDLLLDRIQSMQAMEAAIGDYISARGGSLDPLLGSLGNSTQLSLLPTDPESTDNSGDGEGGEQEEGDPVGTGAGETTEQSDVEGVGNIRSDDSFHGSFRL